MRKKFLTESDFKAAVLNINTDGELRMTCEDSQGETHTLTFLRYNYEDEDGNLWPFIVYSKPFTRDADLIQEDSDYGWEPGIHAAWEEMTVSCGLRPFIAY